MKKILSVVIAIFLFITNTGICFAAEEKGKLSTFEEEVGKKDAAPQTSSNISGADIAVQSFIDILFQFFMMGLMQTTGESFSEMHKNLKKEWSPALPTIRLEPSYQYVAKNLSAFSGKLEAGYLIFGVDGEYSRYFEKAPNNSLNVIDGHFMLRSLFTNYFGVNLALGVRQVRGGQKYTGFDFGFPFYIYFSKYFFADVLPYMTVVSGKNMYDIGGGLSGKYKLIGARLGYRAFFVGNEKLHGPRIGVFLQW